MANTWLQTLESILNEFMPWMYWKGEVAVFLVAFFFFLLFLAVVSLRMSSEPRRGIFGLKTTLGDRIFLAVALLVAVMLITAALNLPWFTTLIIGTPLVIIVLLKG